MSHLGGTSVPSHQGEREGGEESATPGTVTTESFSLSLVCSSNVPLLCVFHSEYSERVEQEMRTQQFGKIVREVLAMVSILK